VPERPGILKRYRHAQLLAALALLLLVEPFAESFISGLVMDGFLLITVASVVVACSTSRRHLLVGLALAASMQVARVYREVHDMQAVSALYSMLALALFGYVTALVLLDVFRSGTNVSSDTICGAVAVYMLLGVVWSFAYALLESFSPGSFSGLASETGVSIAGDYQRFFGYSFVTLTTLGYGNVVPATSRADALAITEAMAGQVYLTVLVARLVALSLKDADGGGRPPGPGAQNTT